MPVYSFRNVNTNEEFEDTMRSDELKEYLVENAELKQIFVKFPGTVDSVRIGVRKVDSSFNDVLIKAKSAHKYSTINTK